MAAESQIEQLALSFPALCVAQGVRPWNPEEFATWASGQLRGSAALYAAEFVLGVWKNKMGEFSRFDVVAAMRAWDDEHRNAFLRWSDDPWWP